MNKINVLSVDIDFLFTDMLKYQEFIDTSLTPAQSWQVIAWKTGTSDYRPCLKSNQFLEEVIQKKCLGAKVFHIEEHDQILEVMEDNGFKDVNMYNMDYHSDITYGNEDDKLNIENWVLYGRKNGIIDQYWWITQDDAKLGERTPIRYVMSSWKDMDVNKLPEFDVVVFCISRHFTPKKFWSLAERLCEYTRNIQEVNNGIFKKD